MNQFASYVHRLSTHCRRILIALMFVVGLMLGTFSSIGMPLQLAHAATSLPCDIYAAAGTPCVAAHSTTRALYAAYSGNLYQVKRLSDSTTLNIGTLTAGGLANAAAQDSFCANTSCIVTEIYDQSGKNNNLTIEGAGGDGGQDYGADAATLPITIGGQKVYGLYISAGVGYRDDATSGVATNGSPEGMYMVTSGTYVDGGCCFDYGNAETNNEDTGNGHMDAINFSTECWFSPCSGSGPWVQADMENGLFAGGNGSDTANLGNSSPFVTALLKNNGQNTYTIKGGNAQSGGLSTWYSGAEPDLGGYSPMHQEGAIVLGTGGDDSNSSVGSFFEGVMTAGYPTDAADNAVQANIASIGYSGSSGPSYYHLVNRNSGLVMATAQNTDTAGTDLVQEPNTGSYSQQWSLVPTGNGYDELVNRYSGQVADVSGGSTSSGTNVLQWQVDGGYNQDWSLKSLGSGYYNLVNQKSSQLADVSGGSTASGADVIQWPSNGGANQQWSLSLVQNAGFETGDCTDYNCYSGATVVASHAHSGTYALQLPSSSTTSSGAEQTITGLSPSTTYTLTGWAESAIAGNCVYLGVKNYGGTETKQCLSSTSYTQGSVSFTTGSTNTTATIYLYTPTTSTSTDGWGDDLAVS